MRLTWCRPSRCVAVSRSLLFTVAVCLFWITPYSGVVAQEQPAKDEIAGGSAPLLRLSNNGPLSAVTSLAISPNGQVLYAGGWDKVVHVWSRQGKNFVYDPRATYRIPVGGGLDGSINVLALSDDGQWLAVGGRGAKRGVAGQRDSGYLMPGGSLSTESWMDEGQIYVFNTSTRECITLRGHLGAVVALAFAASSPGHPPTLISICSTELEGRSSGQIAAWNIATRSQIGLIDEYVPTKQGGTQPVPLPAINVSFPPRIVAWWDGPAPNNLRAAMTWGVPEFGLRIWNVAERRIGPAITNDPVHYFSIEGSAPAVVLSGGGNTRTGKIEFGKWSITGKSLPARERDYTTLHQFGMQEYITNIVPGTKKVGGCVIISDFQNRKARLVAFSQDGKTIVKEQPLWDGLFSASVARASQEGTLAICRAGASEILIFDEEAPQLGTPPQQLNLNFARANKVAFVQNGDSPGLKVQLANRNQVVFDLFNGKWRPATADWQDNSLQAQDWTITPGASGKGTLILSVKAPGQAAQQLDIRSRANTTADTVLTAAAIAPETEDRRIPLLICALSTNLTPELQVYDLRTGEQIRQFTGHTGTIRDLSVTKDGRLVASVADDHTLSVWSLTDIPAQLDKHGLLREKNELLKVDQRDGKIIASNSIKGIPAETEIRSVVIEGKTITFTEPKKLYNFFHGRKPGETATLNTSAGDVAITIGEAITDRKPLFTVFAANSGNPEEWQWIAWNPLGPYSASGRTAERFLGWHFNTGDPNAPTRFASAEGYRDEYETPRLLEFLYLYERLPDRKLPPPPAMSLQILNPERRPLAPEFDGLVPVSTSPLSVYFEANGKVSKRFETMEFILKPAGGAEQMIPSKKIRPGEWEVPLDQFPLVRGANRIVARLTTNEFPPRVFEEAVSVRFQPPPPGITLTPISMPVETAELAFQFTLTPSQVPALAHLVVRDEKGEILAEKNWSEPISAATTLEQKVTLKPGRNRFEITAVNVGALKGFERGESVTKTLDVQFQEPPPPPVEIEAVAIDQKPIMFSSTGDLEVDSPEITLAGRVVSPGAIRKVEVAASGKELTIDSVIGKEGTLEFEQKLDLKPGPNIIQLRGESDASGKGDAVLRVNYRPLLPLLTNFEVTPIAIDGRAGRSDKETASSDHEMVLIRGVHEPRVRVSAVLQHNSEDRDVQTVVLIDDVPHPEIGVQTQGDRILATVPVKPGRQRIQFQISNPWQRVANSPEVIVDYRRPPQVEIPEVPPSVVMVPKIDSVEVIVQSANDLPPLAEQLKVEMNGKPILCQGHVDQLGDDRWRVTIHDLVLDREGDNTARILIPNQDGFSAVPAVRSWTLMTPPKEKPVITVLGPGAQTRYPTVQLVFTVRSDSKFIVRIDRIHAAEISEPLAGTDGNGVGQVTSEIAEDGLTTFTTTLSLDEGPNQFRILASNDGGTQTEEFTISRIPEPIRLRISHLANMQPVRKNEQLSFERPVPEAAATLEGIIEWDADLPRPPEETQVWVNGFMQKLVPLEEIPNEKQKKAFKVPLLFSREKGNRVELSVPGVAFEQLSVQASSFHVDCEKPQSRQVLHLLIIGALPTPPENYGAILEARARDALRAKLGPNQQLVSDAFTRIQSTLVIGEEADYAGINSVFVNLPYHLSVSQQASESPENVVLIVYYHGREAYVREMGGYVLATADTWEKPTQHLSRCLTNIVISTRLNKLYGAHLLLLDVESLNVTQESRWPDDPHLGIVRTVWNNTAADTPRLMSAIARSPATARQLGDVLSGIDQAWAESGPYIKDFNVPDVLQQLELRGAALD